MRMRSHTARGIPLKCAYHHYQYHTHTHTHTRDTNTQPKPPGNSYQTLQSRAPTRAQNITYVYKHAQPHAHVPKRTSCSVRTYYYMHITYICNSPPSSVSPMCRTLRCPTEAACGVLVKAVGARFCAPFLFLSPDMCTFAVLG